MGAASAKDICNRDCSIDSTVVFAAASACFSASVDGWSAARDASLLRKLWIAATKLLATKLASLSFEAQDLVERLA